MHRDLGCRGDKRNFVVFRRSVRSLREVVKDLLVECFLIRVEDRALDRAQRLLRRKHIHIVQYSFLQKERIQVLFRWRLPAHIKSDGHNFQVTDLLNLLRHLCHDVKFRTDRVFCGLILILQMLPEQLNSQIMVRPAHDWRPQRAVEPSEARNFV